MKIARLYTFRIRFSQSAKLPKWKGRILRGAVGFWLRKLFCVTNGSCEACAFVFRCPFGYLFRARSKGIALRKLKGYAKPVVFKPPLTDKQVYAAGEELTFSVVLFGDAVQYENELVRAVLNLCNAGIGEKGARGRAELLNVFVENPMRQKKDVLFDGGAFYDTSLWIRDQHLDGTIARLFELHFNTPFRLIKSGALISEPSFSDLARFMLRKYSAIRYQYVGDELNFDKDKFLKAVEKIRTRKSRLERRKFVYRGEPEDYIYGSIWYSGKLNRTLRKVLIFCQLSHIGKRASFGHGWYRVNSCVATDL